MNGQLLAAFPTRRALLEALDRFWGENGWQQAPDNPDRICGACPSCLSKGRPRTDAEIERYPLLILGDPHEVLVCCRCSEAAIVAALSTSPDRFAGRRHNLRRLLATSEISPPWRVEPVAADGHLTVLAASGGDGKTWAGLTFAGGVAAGSSVAGLPCSRGRAVIFDAENGPYVLGSRLALIAPELPPERVAIYDAEGLRLTAPDDLRWMHDVLHEEQANLFVLDSLRALAPDIAENDSDEVAPVVVAAKNLARQSGAAGVLLHHRGHDRARDFRGSTALRDQADLLYVLERAEGDPESRTRRRLRCSKTRLAEEPDDHWLAIRSTNGQVELCEANPFEPGRRAESPARDEVAAAIVAELRDQTAPIPRAEIARLLGRKAGDGTLRRAVDQLVSSGEVERRADGLALTTSSVASQAVATLASPPRGQPAKGEVRPVGPSPDGKQAGAA